MRKHPLQPEHAAILLNIAARASGERVELKSCHTVVNDHYLECTAMGPFLVWSMIVTHDLDFRWRGDEHFKGQKEVFKKLSEWGLLE